MFIWWKKNFQLIWLFSLKNAGWKYSGRLEDARTEIGRFRFGWLPEGRPLHRFRRWVTELQILFGLADSSHCWPSNKKLIEGVGHPESGLLLLLLRISPRRRQGRPPLEEIKRMFRLETENVELWSLRRSQKIRRVLHFQGNSSKRPSEVDIRLTSHPTLADYFLIF